jgi:hypothetical protein
MCGMPYSVRLIRAVCPPSATVSPPGPVAADEGAGSRATVAEVRQRAAATAANRPDRECL